MHTPLFKILGKSKSSVERIGTEVIRFESSMPHYFNEIVPLVNNNIEIGIEIEIERIQANMVTSYPIWASKQDGSLRENGVEYVSAPISGKRIHYAINQFFDMVNRGFHFSPRTSIHIHMNALDMTPAQMATMLCAYVVFEKLFYRFVGGDRDKNNFCVPMVESDVGLLEYFLVPHFVPPALDHARYMGLNIDALHKFGSLEFRHLGGTSNKAKIINWINLIFCLKQYAMKHAFEDVKIRIAKLNTDSQYFNFLNEIFEPKVAMLLDQKSLQKDCEDAVTKLKVLWSKETLATKLRNSLTGSATWYSYLMGNKEKKKTYAFKPFPVRNPRREAPRARPLGLDVGLFGRGVEFHAPPPPDQVQQIAIEPLEWDDQDAEWAQRVVNEQLANRGDPR